MFGLFSLGMRLGRPLNAKAGQAANHRLVLTAGALFQLQNFDQFFKGRGHGLEQLLNWAYIQDIQVKIKSTWAWLAQTLWRHAAEPFVQCDRGIDATIKMFERKFLVRTMQAVVGQAKADQQYRD